MSKTRLRIACLCIGLMPLLNGCLGEGPTGVDRLQGNAFDWPVSTPTAQGLDADVLQDAFELAASITHMQSLLVVRNGYLVGEEYFDGTDENSMVRLFSATKSVTSALIGIAIRQGYIESLDQPMMDHLEAYDSGDLDSRMYDITIRHLLTMQSGIDAEENIAEAVSTAPNMVAAILDTELQFDPGTDFLYSSHGSQLLSAVITTSTGVSTLEFSLQTLFTPIGVETVSWHTDQNGIQIGGGDLFLTPRDMARFGWLYLEEGFVNGRQIVPLQWIEESTRNYLDETSSWFEMEDVGYGLHWWTGRFDEYSVYAAIGYAGQWILNIPDLDMVIVAVMNPYAEDAEQNSGTLIPLVYNNILPAVVD